jgi:hypothetical protein
VAISVNSDVVLDHDRSAEIYASMQSNRSGTEKNAVKLRWLLLVAGVGFVYLYTSLFGLTGTPVFRPGDQDFFWTYGSRLLSGQVFLRDFHQFTPPGTDLVYEAVFRVFGAGVQSFDWTILCVGLALALVCFVVALQIMRAEAAALAALLCLALLYGDRMDATHHWFSAITNLPAILVLMRGRSYLRIAVAAGLVSVAAFFTQTTGAMGLLACCTGLWWEHRMGGSSWRTMWLRWATLVAGTFAAWLALSWRFIARAGVSTYWDAQVAYLPKDANFPSGFLIPPFNWPGSLLGWISATDHLAVYLLLLSICPWVAALCMRRGHEMGENSVALSLLASLGILQTIEMITMLNWNRMAAVAMPAVILGTWLIGRIGPAKRRVMVGCWCVAGAMMLVQPAVTQLHRYPLAHLPTGTALLQEEEAEEVEWLIGHTHPGDCFFEAANTRYYVPLALRNPTPADVLSTRDITLPQWVDESVEDLQACPVRYILWSPHSGIGRVETRGDRLDPLRAYMRRDFTRVQTFANGDEMWGPVKGQTAR